MPVRFVSTRRFADSRGWFTESYNAERFAAVGIDAAFVQDNHSLSRPTGTLRGIHLQAPPFAQAKLVRCIAGRVFDVAVDLRRQSPTFARWVGVELSAEGGEQLFIPQGFGHAFLTLEPASQIVYKVDNPYAPSSERGIAWNDTRLAIAWPLGESEPLLSEKDRILPPLDALDIDFPYDGCPLSTPELEQI